MYAIAAIVLLNPKINPSKLPYRYRGVGELRFRVELLTVYQWTVLYAC